MSEYYRKFLAEYYTNEMNDFKNNIISRADREILRSIKYGKVAKLKHLKIVHLEEFESFENDLTYSSNVELIQMRMEFLRRFLKEQISFLDKEIKLKKLNRIVPYKAKKLKLLIYMSPMLLEALDQRADYFKTNRSMYVTQALRSRMREEQMSGNYPDINPIDSAILKSYVPIDKEFVKPIIKDVLVP